MSDSDSEKDLDEIVIDSMSKMKRRAKTGINTKAKVKVTSGTAALLSADHELFPLTSGVSSNDEPKSKRARKNRRTHITSEKYGIGRFVGLHTPIQMRSVRNETTQKQEEKRRMCIYCSKRIYTMCKECNTAVCFANTFEKAEESCWYLHHHEPSLIPIPASLQATL